MLVVDDADRLPDDALEIVVRLAELPGDHGKLVRVILFADSAILPRFDTARFASAPRPHRLDLKPLDEAQTIAYLQHRLATAGFAGGPLFLPRDLKRIHAGLARRHQCTGPRGIDEPAQRQPPPLAPCRCRTGGGRRRRHLAAILWRCGPAGRRPIAPHAGAGTSHRALRGAGGRAVAALPAPLKRVVPWIRPFADVHADLSAAGVAR